MRVANPADLGLDWHVCDHMMLRTLIKALLEPCESRGQAVLTMVGMLVVAILLFGIAFLCAGYAESARMTLSEFEVQQHKPSWLSKPHSGLYATMVIWYSIAGVFAIGAGAFGVFGIVIAARSVAPQSSHD
jgi:Mn2+/Fe2+ NRAMP family transporter